jgi:hypothetical protein
MEAMIRKMRWQDWGNLVVGAWLFISPWVMQYPTDMPNVANNVHLLGAAIFIFGAIAVLVPQVWEEGINIVLGLWMIISPWALQYQMHKDVTSNAIIVGILVVALALWAIIINQSVEKRRQDPHAAP